MATKLCDVKSGHTLIADSGFDCIASGSENRVYADEKNLLYVKCKEGHHYLEGQADAAGNLVGLELPQSQAFIEEFVEKFSLSLASLAANYKNYLQNMSVPFAESLAVQGQASIKATLKPTAITFNPPLDGKPIPQILTFEGPISNERCASIKKSFLARGEIINAQRKVLAALSWWESFGHATVSRSQVASSILKNSGNSVLAHDLEAAIKALEPEPPKPREVWMTWDGLFHSTLDKAKEHVSESDYHFITHFREVLPDEKPVVWMPEWGDLPWLKDDTFYVGEIGRAHV